MTKSWPHRLLSNVRRPWWTGLVLVSVIYVLVLAFSLVFTLIQTKRIISDIKTRQFNQVSSKLNQVRMTTRTANFLTGHQSPDLRLAARVSQLSWELWPTIGQLRTSIEQNQSPDLSSLNQTLSGYGDLAAVMATDLDQSVTVPLWLGHDQTKQLVQILTDLSAAAPSLTKLLSDQTRILFIFQNRNELRASGGFMGSYLLLTINRGRIEDLSFEDIYDADGQFTGFVPAPPGVKEYLSSDKGLRLPDSNWSIEFSRAAPVILSYFSLGKRTNIDLLVALNQRPITQLLSQTGPITLPDYQTQLTGENIDQLLQNRGEFFPGSRAKTQILTAAFTQLKTELISGRVSLASIMPILTQAVSQKDIQAYSTDPEMQKLLGDLSLTGDIKSRSHIPPIYLVESNVGINKINVWVERDLVLRPEDNKLTLELNWHNSAPPTPTNGKQVNKSSQNYINYQRLVLPATWAVTQIRLDGQPVAKIDQTPLELVGGLSVIEWGFLVTVAPQASNRAVIEIKTEPDLKQLQLVSQPGQKSYPVLIQTGEKSSSYVLDQDLVVSW